MPEQTKPCYFIIDYDVATPPTSNEIQKLLEKGSDSEKLDALKTLILMVISDENFPRMVMHVIKNASRVDSKEMKKLLLLYWEAIEKTNPDGSIKDEMVMLCNDLRNDLLSPNEFVRARTLRLVTKMKYLEMMDTLLQPVLECLTHRHPYVRRNAVMCVYSLFMKFGEELLTDATQRVDEMLATETDLNTRRNALLFLFEAAPAVATKYLNSVLLGEDEAHGASADILQLLVLDELKKLCKVNPSEKSKHLKSIFTLANSTKSQSVLFECASTIEQLTRSPSAIKLAVATYVKLLSDRSADNNVKLIVLGKLQKLCENFQRLVQEQAVDILRVLTDSSNDIRKSCIELSLNLLSSKNVEDITRILKKELVSVQNSKQEREYQELLVEALHRCALSYPDITGEIGLVEVLMDCCLLPTATAEEVASFIQQLVVKYPALRSNIMKKITLIFNEIQLPSVYRSVLWVLAEYSDAPEGAIELILRSIGEGPYINKREAAQQYENTAGEEEFVHKTVVLPDGTYGTQILSASQFARPYSFSGLRQLLTEVEEVDFYLVTVIATTLTKLLFQLKSLEKYKTEVLLLMCRLVQIRTFPKKTKNGTEHTETAYAIDPDNFERVVHCIQTVTGLCEHSWVNAGKDVYRPGILLHKEDAQDTKDSALQFDDLLSFTQLKGREGLADLDLTEENPYKLLFKSTREDLTQQNIQTLTGSSDPAYIECSLLFQHYDVILEFTVFNKSTETLQNMTLELASCGDLRIVERPLPCSLAPGHTVALKSSVKVISTEAGTIFGNLTFDLARGGTFKVLTLNPIRIDTIEYIVPAPCTDSHFRKLWQELRWECPVSVNSHMTDLYEYTKRLSNKANMQIVTPEAVLLSNADFLVCNMYAQSRFAEDALLNLSLERASGKITGHIKVRAKSEGMSKSLGEKLTGIQKRLNK